MTKQEFEETDEPLGLIVSINPVTGKLLFDIYGWDEIDFWVSEMEKNFPDFITMSMLNAAAIIYRAKFFLS